jgi:hypothetical protein
MYRTLHIHPRDGMYCVHCTVLYTCTGIFISQTHKFFYQHIKPEQKIQPKGYIAQIPPHQFQVDLPAL